MKYPKVWGTGPDTARIVGEARLRGLEQVGLPHLKAAGPGFVAYRLGPTSEVHIVGEAPEHDEIFAVCFNSEADWGDKPLRVGRDLRRAFFASKLSDNSSLQGTVASITYSGDGRLWAYGSPESLGGHWWRQTLHASPNARRFAQLYSYEHLTDFNRRVSDALPPGAKIPAPAGGTAWSFGVGYRTASPGATFARYDYSLDGGATWGGGTFGYGAGYDHGVPNIVRWNPTQLLVIVPTYKTTADSFGFQLHEDPHLTFGMRLDGNGASGVALDLGPLVSGLVDYTDHATFNRMLAEWADGMAATPLVDQSLLVLVGSALYSANPADPVHLRLYRLSLAGGVSLVTQFETPGGYLPGYVQLGPTGGRIATSRLQLVDHRPVFVARTADPLAPPTLFVGDIRGNTWVSRPMPFPQYRTGHIAALDKTLLGCPMYDAATGEYRLYVTDDFGVEWKPWGRLSKDSAPPPDIWPVMVPYGRVHYVRGLKRRPIPTYPGAEWIGDASVPIPVELLT